MKAEAADVGSNQVSYGAYEDAMKQARQTFNVPDDKPTKSPFVQKPRILVDIYTLPNLVMFHPWLQSRPTCNMLQLTAMRAPVTLKIGLEIANSMVKGEWKKKHGVHCNDNDDPAKLGQRYWHFFEMTPTFDDLQKSY